MLQLQRPLSTQGSVAIKWMCALLNPCLQRTPAQGDTEVLMVPCECLCILGHGIVNLQKRCLGSGSVSVLLGFASKGWVFSSLCCLSHLCLGSLCIVELEGFFISLHLQNKITALGSQLLMCIRFWLCSGLEFGFVHFCASPTQSQHDTSRSLNVNLREAHGKSGPLLLRFNLLAQPYLMWSLSPEQEILKYWSNPWENYYNDFIYKLWAMNCAKPISSESFGWLIFLYQ